MSFTIVHIHIRVQLGSVEIEGIGILKPIVNMVARTSYVRAIRLCLYNYLQLTSLAMLILSSRLRNNGPPFSSLFKT